MSQDGAIMDAVAARISALISGITTERGLSDPADQPSLPYAYLFDPALEVTNLEYQQRSELVSFFVILVFSDTQENVLAEIDKIRLDLAADPFAGAEGTLKAQGVRRIFYQGHSINEAPGEHRKFATLAIQAERITS